jgi:hypothetical protein
MMACYDVLPNRRDWAGLWSAWTLPNTSYCKTSFVAELSDWLIRSGIGLGDFGCRDIQIRSRIWWCRFQHWKPRLGDPVDLSLDRQEQICIFELWSH